RPAKSVALPKNGSRTARDRICDVFAAIARLAGIGHERVAARDEPAVAHEVVDTQRVDRGPVDAAGVNGCVHTRCLGHGAFHGQSGHASSLTSGSLAGGRTTLFTGASGGMARSRT